MPRNEECETLLQISEQNINHQQKKTSYHYRTTGPVQVFHMEVRLNVRTRTYNKLHWDKDEEHFATVIIKPCKGREDTVGQPLIRPQAAARANL